MSHDELLARIDKEIQFCGTDTHSKCKSPEENLPWQALRAVVELHKPINYTKEAYPNRTDLPDVFFCSACTIAGVSSYPCPTIQAIKKELK